jgi:hypothetical protein
MAGGLANPTTYVDCAPIPFFLQWLLAILEPLTVCAIIYVDNAFVLRNKKVLIFTWHEIGRNWLKCDIIIFAHETSVQNVSKQRIEVVFCLPQILVHFFQKPFPSFYHIRMLISIMISTFLDVFTQVTQFLQPADGSSF